MESNHQQRTESFGYQNPRATEWTFQNAKQLQELAEQRTPAEQPIRTIKACQYGQRQPELRNEFVEVPPQVPVAYQQPRYVINAGQAPGEFYNETSRSNEPRQFAMNSAQPLFRGKFNEDVDEWLFTTTTNMEAAGIQPNRKVIVAAGYLRENALQVYRQLCKLGGTVTWTAFRDALKNRFGAGEATESLVRKLCSLKQEASLEDYIDKFTATANKGNLPEEVTVGLFSKGLTPELSSEVAYRKPGTLVEAIRMVVEFATFKLGHKFGAQAVASYAGPSAKKVGDCYNCGRAGHFAKDCYARKKADGSSTNGSQGQPRTRPNGGRQQEISLSALENALKEISQQLKNMKCGGSDNDKKRAFNNSRGPPLQEQQSGRRQQYQEPEQRVAEQEPVERERRSAKRKHVQMDVGEPAAKANLFSGDNEARHLFKVAALFNGVEIEAILDTGASITVISKSLADAMEVEIDRSKSADLQLADGTQCKSEGLTEKFTVEVGGKAAVLSALVLPVAESPTLLGLDWFHATSAAVCPKFGTVEFLESRSPGAEAVMLISQSSIKEMADYKLSNILADLGFQYHPPQCRPAQYQPVECNPVQYQPVEYKPIKLPICMLSHSRPGDAQQVVEHTETHESTAHSTLKTDQDSDNESIDEFDQETSWPSEAGDGKRFYETFNEERLSKGQNDAMRRLFKKFDDVFAYSMNDLKIPCDLMPLEIELTDNKPVYTPPFRHTEREHELIELETKANLEAGIIRPSKSPYNSPILFVPKSDGRLRFCLDLRNLNKKTVPSTHVMIPRQDDIFRKLNKAMFFALGDLKNGYWQQKVHPDSIHKTAYQTRSGKFECLRVPFGLRNAPFEFNRLMKHVFQDVSFVEVYFDDIIIASESIEEHMKHIKIVLERLRKYKLKINPKKLHVFKTSIKILGHVISHKSVAMDEVKVNKIANWASPRNNDDLRSFLGLCGYYRRFIENYAHITAEFGNIESKEKFEWTKTKEITFRLLKHKFKKAPILRQPDWSLEFQIHTDASGKAVGAILCQRDNLGYEYVIEFASKALTKAEVNYTVTEQECLAVKWGIAHFRVYVHGRKFIVKTDHKALKWLMEIKEPAGRLARWILFLQSFDFVIEYREGKKHSNADAVSRYGYTLALFSILFLEPYQDQVLMDYLRDKQLPAGASTKQCNRLRKSSEKLVLIDDYVWIKRVIDDTEQLFKIPKPNERAKIVLDAHKLGHFGTRETYLRIKEEYYWKKMYEFIDNIVKRCDTCLRFNKARDFAHPAMALPVKSVFDRVTMDLVFGFPTTKEGFKGMLVIVIYTTKYPWAVPIKSKTAEEIAWHFLNFIAVFGAPKQILSDQGKEFLNKVVEGITTGFGIEHRITSAYKPDTNGLTECMNKTLTGALRKHAEENPATWNLMVPLVLMAYRSRVHPSTGFTPHELMFGVKMNVFKADKQEEEKEATEVEIFNRSKDIQKLTEVTIPKAIKNIEAAQEQQKKSQDNRNNVLNEVLQLGQRVFIKSKKIENKFEIKNHGPYTVIGKTTKGNYYLRNNECKQLAVAYPLSRLKLMEPVADATIEKILNHRKVNGIIEYRVKYNADVFPVEWIPVTEFKSTVLIEHYHNNISKEQAPDPTPTHSLNLVSLILFALLLISGVSGNSISDNFMLCISNENSQLIEASGVCRANVTQATTRKANFTVLERRKYIVSGQGTFCKRSKIFVRTWTEFFGITTIREVGSTRDGDRRGMQSTPNLQQLFRRHHGVQRRRAMQLREGTSAEKKLLGASRQHNLQLRDR